MANGPGLDPQSLIAGESKTHAQMGKWEFYSRGDPCSVVLVVKNLPSNAGGTGDSGSIPGSGRFPGGGHGKPLQYSCLVNPMDRGAWWVRVPRVAKS